MKTVLLLRHAKSSWDDPLLGDFERPLAPRGRKAAPLMGRFMARNGLIPNRVLCSGARRAVETLRLASEDWPEDRPEDWPEDWQEVQVETLDEIYHASPSSLLQLIHALPQGEESVLLVGHNPTFEELASRLAGSGKDEALEALAQKYPTGALAILDFHIGTWAEVEPGKGSLRDFIRPKTLK